MSDLNGAAPGRLIRLKEAWQIFSFTPQWFRAHRNLPFIKQVGRIFLVDEAAARRWFDRQRAQKSG